MSLHTAMTRVYKLTADGWVMVYRAQSFAHACWVARELEHETGVRHCVNS